MLNNFCFHLYAQKSLFIGENCNAFFLTAAAPPSPVTLEFIELVPSETDICSPAQPKYQAESGGNAKTDTGRLEKTIGPAKASFPVGGSMWALSRLHKTRLVRYMVLAEYFWVTVDPNRVLILYDFLS